MQKKFFLIFFLLFFSFLVLTQTTENVQANDPPYDLVESINTTTSVNISFSRNTSIIIEVATNGFNWAIHDRNGPQAIYNETMNWTIIGWGGTPSTYVVDQWVAQPYIRYFNHSNSTWSQPHQVGTSVSDHHGTPALAINETGHIYIFYSGHVADTYKKYKYSNYSITDPSFDITKWSVSHPFCYIGTYQDAIVLDNGTMFVFGRNQLTQWEVNISYDFGKTWNPRPIIYMSDGGAPYQYVSGYKYHNDKVHLSWNKASGSFDRSDAFYAYLNVTDMLLYNVTNASMGVLIDSTEALNSCLVEDTTGSVNRISNQVQVDIDPATEAPYITYAHNPSGNTVWWNFSHYDYSSNVWSNEHMFLTNCSSGSCYLQVNSTNDIQAFLSRNSTLERWFYNGSIWMFNETIYSGNASKGESGMMRTLQHVGDHTRWEETINKEMQLVFSTVDDSSGTWDDGYLYPEDKATWNLSVYTYGHEKPYIHIRYSESDNLTTYTDGNEGYNGTDTSVTISDLDSNTTYYLQAWSYSRITGWNTTGSNTIILRTQIGIPDINKKLISMPDYNGAIWDIYLDQSDSNVKLECNETNDFGIPKYTFWDNESTDGGEHGYRYHFQEADLSNGFTTNCTVYYRFTCINGTDNGSVNNTGQVDLWSPYATGISPVDATELVGTDTYLNATINITNGGNFTFITYNGSYFSLSNQLDNGSGANQSISYHWQDLAYSTMYTWCIQIETNDTEDNGNISVRSNAWGTANEMTFWTLNNSRVGITNHTPANGSTGISISTDNLTFNLTDVNGNDMNYSYVALLEGCIQGGGDLNVSNGTHAIELHPDFCLPLEYSTVYTWYVNVSDGYEWVNESYSFTTEVEPEDDTPTPPSGGGGIPPPPPADDDEEDGVTDGENQTPGFGIALIFVALLSIILLFRRKKHE